MKTNTLQNIRKKWKYVKKIIQNDMASHSNDSLRLASITPKKADKGELYGSCNVTACQHPNLATWYNKSTEKYYCSHCARRINDANKDYARENGEHLCTHHSGHYCPNNNFKLLTPENEELIGCTCTDGFKQRYS